MSQGRHSKKAKMNKKRSLGAVLALVMLVIAVAGTTIAYLSHSSEPVVNSFTLSEITCDIEETVRGGVKSSVMVKNTGETAAFIRVAVIANTVDGKGSITGPANVDSYFGGANWVKSGMYYYYTQPVSPNETTGELLKGPINLTGIQVTILAEAIQSEPASAAESAWGVKPASLGSN